MLSTAPRPPRTLVRTRTHRRRTLVAALLLAAMSACGGDSDGPDITSPLPGNGSMTARIDGANWSGLGVSASATPSTPAVLAIGGSDTQSTMAIAWSDEGTGTYTIGASIGLNATLVSGSSGWTAAGTQGSGTLTVTTRTATRVAGTFSFTLVASGAGSSGTRSITNGTFDIRF